MHHPIDQPRPSLYYTYRVFDAWVPGPVQARQQVVIVGAGPAALTTALELRRHGVEVTVLAAERQVSEGSRAIVFTRRSMEILQQVGVADDVTRAGLPWRFGNSYYRGQHVFRMQAPHDSDDRFFPMINLQQQYLEEFLVKACEAQGVQIRWGNKLLALTQHDDHVSLQVDTPQGPYALETTWLVAADGARSGIRSALGLKMEGASYEGRFVIADIRIDLPLPTERRAYFDPVWNPGNTILMHREPKGIWRIDYQLPPDESAEDALRPESLRERINAQLAMIGFADTPWELDWSSVYSARTLTLPDYRYGRVLFVGDAAHLLPIFGVRGANTAFQDAQALGWQLGFVMRGWAPQTLLDNYSRERVGAAREIIDEAGKSTRFMTPPTRGFRLLRDAVLSLSLTQNFVRPLYHWRTSRPHAYLHSVLNAMGDDNALFATGPGRGEPPQNVQLAPDDYLLDHLGGGLDLLVFGAQPLAVLPQIQSIRARGVPLRVTVISHAPAHIEGADQVLVDVSGRVRQRYGVTQDGAAYLLRPDQHVCARWVTLDAHRLQAAVDAVTQTGSVAAHVSAASAQPHQPTRQPVSA